MNLKYDYIIARPIGEKLTILYCTDSLKNARFWLKLAGEAGDCLFLSPDNEKNTNRNSLTYNCHINSMKFIDFNLLDWLEINLKQKCVTPEQFAGEFPVDSFTMIPSNKTETSVLVLDNTTGGSGTGPESLIGSHWNDLSSLLSEPIEAITGSLIQPGGSENLIFISVGASSDWPCSIKIEQEGPLKSESTSKMQFSVNAKI